VPYIGRAKLFSPKDCSQVVSLAITRLINMRNTYSTVEINKWSFLVGQKLCIMGQREYMVRGEMKMKHYFYLLVKNNEK